MLEDRSSNGTWVNGAMVDGAMELRPGDVIRCGDSFLVLRPPAPTVPDVPSELLRGHAASMVELRHAAKEASSAEGGAMVVGEDGVGKELVARTIHELSGREGAFVIVDCLDLPARLAEGRLFGLSADDSATGHELRGFVEAAAGGTLMLRAIDALPKDARSRLLEFRRTGEITRGGESKPFEVDARLVGTTRAGLTVVPDNGETMSDLVTHLAARTLQVPPLRERRQDILELLCLSLDSDVSVDPDLVEALLLLPWHGNVRELLDIARVLTLRGAGHRKLDVALIADRLARRDARDKRRTLAESPTAIRDSDPGD